MLALNVRWSFLLLVALSLSLLDSRWALWEPSFSSGCSGGAFGIMLGSFASMIRTDCLSLMLKVVLMLAAVVDWYVLVTDATLPEDLLLTSARKVNFCASAKLCLSSSIVQLFEISVYYVCFNFSVSIYCCSSFYFNSSSLILIASYKFWIF